MLEVDMGEPEPQATDVINSLKLEGDSNLEWAEPKTYISGHTQLNALQHLIMQQ